MNLRSIIMIIGLCFALILLSSPHPIHADDFDLTDSCDDVAALNLAIINANASGGESTITLAENCEYSFIGVDIHLHEDRPNLLPSIMGNIVIEGNGAVLNVKWQ